MTRARTQTREFGSQPLSQLLLEAVLFACVMIVSNVAAMFGMRFNRKAHDWHMGQAQEAQPQTKPGTDLKDTNSANSVILGPAPGISVGSPQGPANIPCETDNRDSRHALRSPENDAAHSVAPARQEAGLLVRVARGGGHPVLRAAQTHSHRSAFTRADQTPAHPGFVEGRVGHGCWSCAPKTRLS